MERTCLFASLVSLCMVGLANDGVYLSHGGALYPVKETRISMAREFLSFTCTGDHASVQVLFEFNNPDTIARTLLVGFQAPTGHGDASDSLLLASRVRGLKVLVDGRVLPFTMKAADCEDCALAEVSAFEFHGDSPGVYVYLFEVTFKPGITRVEHSYDHVASSHVYFDRFFNYILTTGSKWANSTIGDFTLQIDMGGNQYFYVTDVFGKEADWSILGTGRVTDQQFDYVKSMCRMVRTISGKLLVHARNLRPDRNIEFGVCSKGSFLGVPLSVESGLSAQVHVALQYSTLDMAPFRMEPLTKDDLRMLRNTIYATHGYVFKDKELRTCFERFAWYVPDPNLDTGAMELTKEEQGLIDGIVKLEKGSR